MNPCFWSTPASAPVTRKKYNPSPAQALLTWKKINPTQIQPGDSKKYNPGPILSPIFGKSRAPDLGPYPVKNDQIGAGVWKNAKQEKNGKRNETGAWWTNNENFRCIISRLSKQIEVCRLPLSLVLRSYGSKSVVDASVQGWETRQGTCDSACIWTCTVSTYRCCKLVSFESWLSYTCLRDAFYLFGPKILMHSFLTANHTPATYSYRIFYWVRHFEITLRPNEQQNLCNFQNNSTA